MFTGLLRLTSIKVKTICGNILGIRYTCMERDAYIHNGITGSFPRFTQYLLGSQ